MDFFQDVTGAVSFKNYRAILVGIIILFDVVIVLTPYPGSGDFESFTTTSKYFAGYGVSKMRCSHSYLWGFLNSFHVALFKSFFGFRIINLAVLFAIIYSIYYISGKNKKALLLALLSPIIWYMAPWINSIQVSTLWAKPNSYSSQ